MAQTSPGSSSRFISRVALSGRTEGRVKQLARFDKSRHVVPDAVNPATTAFLGRLVAPELAEEAEAFFQRGRAALNYKRRDLSLDVTSPTAVLTARDFTLQWDYALIEERPDHFRLTRTLEQLKDPALAHQAEFDALMAGLFDELTFLLQQGVQVDAVIDAVEALPEPAVLRVDYPSDCRTCVLSVEGVPAVVECDGAALSLRFPRAGSPRQLFEAFATVREAFVLSKAGALARLLE